LWSFLGVLADDFLRRVGAAVGHYVHLEAASSVRRKDAIEAPLYMPFLVVGKHHYGPARFF
jgi:hypothetical protein